MNANRMWHLIAEMVNTYAEEGDCDKAMETLSRALSLEPQWIPNALFDERTVRLRDRDDFRQLTAIDPDDAPAHYNAAQVALEFRQLSNAYAYLEKSFQLSQAEGSLPYLLEALQDDESFKPYLRHPKFAALLTKYKV